MSITSNLPALSHGLPSNTLNLSQHHPEHNWQYLLERSIANRVAAAGCLCLHQASATRLLVLQSLVHSGQNLLVAGAIPRSWEQFAKERLYPRGIAVKHSYTNDPASWEAKLTEHSRLLYWFAPDTDHVQHAKALRALRRLSKIYRLPLLVDTSNSPGIAPKSSWEGASLQLGTLPGSQVAWLAEYGHFSWNSGLYTPIAQGPRRGQEPPLISYLRQHWCDLLGLGLHDQTAADAWQRLLADKTSLDRKACPL